MAIALLILLLVEPVFLAFLAVFFEHWFRERTLGHLIDESFRFLRRVYTSDVEAGIVTLAILAIAVLAGLSLMKDDGRVILLSIGLIAFLACVVWLRRRQ